MDPSTFPNPTKVIQFTEPIVYTSRVPTAQPQGGYGNDPNPAPSIPLPPPAAANAICVDGGNCSPRFLRPTVYAVPTTADILRMSNLPLCVCVSPLAEPKPGEHAVPIVDTEEHGPLRCNGCKAYLNCLDQFIAGGREYRCALCQKTNEVPAHYFSPLDARLKRMDTHTRPELTHASIEYVASKDYRVRDPVPLNHVFVLDVSQQSVHFGVLKSFVSVMKKIVESAELASMQGCKIGIITYDTTVHFYSLHSAAEQPQMLVVPEIGNMFLPADADGHLLVSPKESKKQIDSLLDRLPVMFQSTKIPQAAMSAAVTAARLMLAETGGKVYVMQKELPSYGPIALKNRGAVQMPPEKEMTLYSPQNNGFLKLGEECVDTKVGVETFLFGPQHVDVATINSLSAVTGGRCHFYANFQHPSEKERFEGDLYRSATRAQGYDALMRVRTSNQLSVVSYMGNFYARNSTDIELGTVDCDQVFVVQLKHASKIQEGHNVVVQAAILFTTSTGQRRIRVHTLALDSTATLNGVFRSADLDSILAVCSRSAAVQALKSPLPQVRTAVTDRCIAILSVYKQHGTNRSASAQLVLPETLKLLPIYTCGMMKYPALSSTPNSTVDEKVFLQKLLDVIDLQTLSLVLYPRLFDVLNVAEDFDEKNLTSEGYALSTPPLARLLAENLKPDSVYLMDAGLTLYLWVGNFVNHKILMGLLGVNRLDGILSSDLKLNAENHPQGAEAAPLLKRLHCLIRTLRHRAPHPRPLVVVTPSDSSCLTYRIFLENLVEDRAKSLSYVEFLCQVHREIQKKVGE